LPEEFALQGEVFSDNLQWDIERPTKVCVLDAEVLRQECVHFARLIDGPRLDIDLASQAREKYSESLCRNKAIVTDVITLKCAVAAKFSQYEAVPETENAPERWSVDSSSLEPSASTGGENVERLRRRACPVDREKGLGVVGEPP